MSMILHKAASHLNQRGALWVIGAMMGMLAGGTLDAAPEHPTLPFSGATVVDEINCSQTPAANHHYAEFPAGATAVQTILGSQARVMANPAGGTYRYFSYRIGKGKGLQAGKAYVLEVEYPEDAPRSMVIINQGEAGGRGVHTGRTVGDALNPPFVNNNSESLEIPLAGTWKTWRSLFHLHDRFMDMTKGRDPVFRPLVPADGFNVIIVHYWNEDEPLSAGVAVRKIRLLEAPAFATYDAGLRLPPGDLPRRHIFSREEMYDGHAGLFGETVPAEERGVATTINYFEYKVRLMRFLGMNTFSKDLLEFGGNQGFDSGPGGGNAWYYNAKEPQLWGQIIDMLSSYGMDVLPYYEYAGSKGSNSLGTQKRAKPLYYPALTNYTQVAWAESCRADLSDPETHADAKKLLDVTMTRYKDKVNFVGAWFRGRVSQMPISFSDANIAQFSQEALGGRPLTRAQLQSTSSIYNQYLQWFFGKRREFAEAMRDHLRIQGINKNAVTLFTSDSSEPGSHYSGATANLIAEDTVPWTATGVSLASLSQAISSQWHWKALTTPRSTYSGWEWQHASPYNDPSNWAASNGAMLTYTFNREYTLADSAWMNAFRTPSGLAMIRHFSLNEAVLDSPDDYTPEVHDPLGYFVTDFERSGPFCVMGEALALAKGDPRFLGYLSSTVMNRGFPEYVRAFNRAFVALPAVPSTLGTSSNANVVVRNYATDGYGTYVAVINTARTDQNGAVVTLPFQANVVDATTGTTLATGVNSISFDLYPFQVKALHLKKNTATGPRAVDDNASVNEGASVDINVVANDLGPGTKTVTAVGAAANGTVTILSGTQVRYTPAPGFFGVDSFRYTVSNGTDTDMARVSVTINNTQVAASLASWGIKNTSIGEENTGKSRLLAGGVVGEVTGFGSGLNGTADVGQFASRTVNGDFHLTVRVNSVSGAAADALGGLMVRQSAEPGARMVAALINGAGALQVRSRNVKDGEAAGGGVSTSGNAWIRIKRAGDLLTVEKSADNVNFSEVAWRSLPGLPATLQIGLWAAGGDRYTGSRMLVQSFSVVDTTTGGLFSQDFASSTSFANYVNAGGAPNTFADIGREANAGVWSIDGDGALAISATTLADPNDSGFVRTAALAPLGSVLKFSARIGVTNGSSTFMDFGALDFGNFTTVTDYGASPSTSTMFAMIGFKGAGANAFRFKLDSSSTYYGSFVADGRLYRMTVYLSQSASNQTYYGPDGQQHTLMAGMASLWMDDQPVLENWSRTVLAAYSAAAPSTFRFRHGGGSQIAYRFDDIVVEPRFAAPTPSKTNAGPVAAGDSATVAEGNSIALDVLANDTDSDAGPDGLRITAASSSAGTASVVNGRIVFTPASGFTGVATINYTISDGLATSNAAASVTVTSTATATNLTSKGLNGVAIGSGVSGGSRILSDGYWEVKQTGGAGTATADKLWWERKSATGDFQAEVRIRSLLSYGTGASGGLMIRETTATGSRMVQISLDPAAVAKAVRRLTLNGSAAQTGVQAALTYPAAWLQLERTGSYVTARVSSDGMTFVDLDTVQISGLAATVEAGLWATNARIEATGFIVRPYQPELLKMDFQQSTSYQDYAQELDPEPNQLSDIGAEPLAGAWSIDTGRLRLVRSADTSADSGAGFMRSVAFPGPPAVLKVSFDLTMGDIISNNIELWHFELGNFPKVTDYNGGIVSAPIFSRLTVRSKGTGLFTFRMNGVNSANYATSAGAVKVTFYANNSGSTTSYETPDGLIRQLDHRSLSLWLGGPAGTLAFENVPTSSGFDSETIGTFRFRMQGPSYTAWFDNLTFDTRLLTLANQAPVALNDSATLDEGTSVDVNVLANDSDPDNIPSPLAIQTVGTPANGTASIVAGKVRYTPNAGFYGSDSVSYSISDGAATASATVNFTVNNTASAMNLNAFQLGGVDIGGATGSSRVLSTGNWEVNGSGSGLGDTADAFHGELQSVTGDFEMVVRVAGLQAANDGRVGLVAREGFEADRRMLGVSLGSDQIVRHTRRTTTAGSAVEGSATGTWSLSNTWLMLKRQGNTLSAAVSADGANYTQLTSQTMSMLSANLQLGLWVAGGGATSARGFVQNFEIDRLDTVFAQNWDRWINPGTVPNYISGTPDLGQFYDLSAALAGGGNSGGGIWSIANTNDVSGHYDGKLTLVRPAFTGTANTNGAGFTRFAVAGFTPSKVLVRFKVGFSWPINDTMDIATLDLGSMSTVTGYTGSTPNPGVANRLVLKGGGASGYRFMMAGVTGPTSPANGAESPVHWYVNHSGDPLNYTGPDGSAQSLANNTSDLWVNGVRQFDDSPRNSVHTAPHMGAMRFRVTTAKESILTLDDLSVTPLP